MTDDLTEALTTVDGVGEARATELRAIVREHDGETGGDAEAARAALAAALDYIEAGRPGYATKYVREAHSALSADGD